MTFVFHDTLTDIFLWVLFIYYSFTLELKLLHVLTYMLLRYLPFLYYKVQCRLEISNNISHKECRYYTCTNNVISVFMACMTYMYVKGRLIEYVN